jgi:hypothetical protein
MATRPTHGRLTTRQLYVLAIAVVVAIVLAIALGGPRGDEALAIGWIVVGILCLPAMIVFLFRGGRRR